MKSESDHETTPVTEYTLHQKKGDSVKWDEFRLPGDRAMHTFEGLQCGTRYQYYITATNAAGKGDPSDILSSKTDGMGESIGAALQQQLLSLSFVFLSVFRLKDFSKCASSKSVTNEAYCLTAPVAPDKHSLLTINSSSASIHLDAWHDGGCPINSVRIMYKMQRNRTWINVRTEEQPLLEKTIVITDLLPSSTYDLKITATNEGGPTEAQYFFTTLHAPRGTNAGVYDTAKCQSQTETLRLSDMDQNHLKKLSTDSNSGLDSGYYPSPYAMTKIEMSERGLNPNIPHSHTSPMKPHVITTDGEPLYATVKRTPRPPRSDVHIYHYPMSVQGTVDSGCDAESWKSSVDPGAAASTAFLRIQEEPCEKTLAGNEVKRCTADGD
ncbi:Down syndrome cell adhesion molecule-like protein Dscam2 [Leptotrombidium deliense]|uniref:Down syndrome cell adhesion molecule-like protein Dscam2 n=1 Tax=Leptotrombidium deliense TaxID=299467 RepID=A0A443SFW0_9ACAR|nr:Down syndrome cell adhesion molecule-like protein Dscam2 [Leptotrombidium deliense]